VVVQTEQEPQTAGELIRFWRTRRGLSQLELSLDANVSTKHLSFVETGRSRPSRQLLVHLAQHLDVPIAERNRLLLAGGFAPPYLELPYDGEVMQPLRESLKRLLEAHEPNPALIVDGLWNLIESNRAASLLWVAWPAGGSCGSWCRRRPPRRRAHPATVRPALAAQPVTRR
jgi:transcriptional regulator with XRE-family HTH domain